MDYTSLIEIIIFAYFVIGVLVFSNLFVKAGRQRWEAFVPIYNYFIAIKIIERPWWWTILLFVPVVGNIMLLVVIYEFLHVFGYRNKRYTLFTILTLGLFLVYVNFNKNTKYVGRDNDQMLSNVSTWTSAILFAVVAATIVHTYFMRPYTIPTSSLEKSLLIGDFLFVSKFHYGARVPMTPIALPMVHDSIPKTGLASYLKKPQLPYMRLPGLQKIKRNDIVVFNWPADTLKTMWGDNSGKFTYKPIDKKTNYVKRATAIAGDTLEIKNGDIYINGKLSKMPDRAKPQFFYKVRLKDFNQINNLLQTYKIKEARRGSDGSVYLNLTDELANRIKNNPNVISLEKQLTPKGHYDKSIFPHDSQYPWSIDNFGPIYIPKKGETVELNEKTIPFYRDLLNRYEGVSFAENGNEYYINGKKTDKYTFKQDYYWMMGDNRQNSLDARYWGFVPFDHVVGKPVFIWMSWDGSKPRFERWFTTVGGSGKPVSYLWVFGIGLVLYFGYKNYKKKKQSA
ncbi:MAG TPA: signal peptidase I [Flavobacteriia bacterium]|nr:signal peptidase I [Flavobacteriia bacterium]